MQVQAISAGHHGSRHDAHRVATVAQMSSLLNRESLVQDQHKAACQTLWMNPDALCRICTTCWSTKTAGPSRRAERWGTTTWRPCGSQGWAVRRGLWCLAAARICLPSWSSSQHVLQGPCRLTGQMTHGSSCVADQLSQVPLSVSLPHTPPPPPSLGCLLLCVCVCVCVCVCGDVVFVNDPEEDECLLPARDDSWP